MLTILDANEGPDHAYLWFSATFPKESRKVAKTYMNEDAVRVRIGRAGLTHKNVTQDIIFVKRNMKKQALREGGIFHHRIGRTSRIGHTDHATSFYNERNKDLAPALVNIFLEDLAPALVAILLEDLAPALVNILLETEQPEDFAPVLANILLAVPEFLEQPRPKMNATRTSLLSWSTCQETPAVL